MNFRNSVRMAVVITSVSTLFAPTGQAAGKKPAVAPPASVPVYMTPKPTRNVVLKDVSTTPFHIPNGKDQPETISADLKLLMQDAIGDTGYFGVQDAGSSEPCGKHLELRSGVSILDLDIAQFGITVGYTGSSDTNNLALAKLDGTFDVKIGNIVMDFGVWECSGTDCTQIVNAEATHLTANVDTSVKMTFGGGTAGGIQVGPDFIWKSPLGGILKKIMQNGLQKLAASTKFDRLYWKSMVMQDYDPKLTNLVFLNAGANSGLGANEMFEIASVTPADGPCAVYKVVGYGHTVQVNSDSAVVQLDQQFFDPAVIRRGDVVKLHITGNTANACTK